MSSVTQLAALHLWGVLPEGCRFGLDQIAHDEPLKIGERSSLEPRVWRTHGRVLPHDEQPFQAIRASVGGQLSIFDAQVVATRSR